MNREFARFALALALIGIGGCIPQEPPPTPPPLPTRTRVVLPTEIATVTPVEPTETAPVATPTLRATIDVAAFPCADPTVVGWLTGDYSYADAGHFVLQAGDLIALTWEDAPEGALKYEFVLLADGSEPPEVLGVDEEWSDGVSIEWLVPENLSERTANAVAYYDDGSTIPSRCFSYLWSGTAPPEGLCSLSSKTAVRLFEVRDLESIEIGDIYPGIYVEVYERAPDGWYLVDGSETFTYGDEYETAWVNERQPVQLHGPCETIPFRSD